MVSYDVYLFRTRVRCGQTQVSDTDVAGRAVDENIVALQVAVNDGRVLRVQVVHPSKYLASPALDHSPSNHFHLSDETGSGGRVRKNSSHKTSHGEVNKKKEHEPNQAGASEYS